MTGRPVPPADRVVDAAHVAEAVCARLRLAGYSAEAAGRTAANLVDAERDGCTSHGLQLLPVYLEEVADGKVDPAAGIELVEDGPTQLVFDARSAPGHGALSTAVDLVAERAAIHGTAVGWVAALPHVGRLAHYLRQALTAPGVVLVTVTSALDPASALVAPPGRSNAVLGSNPLAVGVRGADGREVLYDGSHAAIPFYRLREHHLRGEPLPEAVVVAADGQPSRSPAAFFDGGALLPAGGHRGFGLSLTLAVLSRLCVPAADRGRSTAFVMVVRPPSAADLGPTLDELIAAGAHVPGHRAVGTGGGTLTLRADAGKALASCGIVLP